MAACSTARSHVAYHSCCPAANSVGAAGTSVLPSWTSMVTDSTTTRSAGGGVAAKRTGHQASSSAGTSESTSSTTAGMPGATGQMESGKYPYRQAGSEQTMGSSEVPPNGVLGVGPVSAGQQTGTYQVDPNRWVLGVTFAVANGRVSIVDIVDQQDLVTTDCRFPQGAVSPWPIVPGSSFNGTGNCQGTTMSYSGQTSPTSQQVDVGGTELSVYTLSGEITTTGAVRSSGNFTLGFSTRSVLPIKVSFRQSGSYQGFPFSLSLDASLQSLSPT